MTKNRQIFTKDKKYEQTATLGNFNGIEKMTTVDGDFFVYSFDRKTFHYKIGNKGETADDFLLHLCTFKTPIF